MHSKNMYYIFIKVITKMNYSNCKYSSIEWKEVRIHSEENVSNF